MSEHAIVLVELTTSETEAPGRAAAVADWLLGRGVIEPNTKPDALRGPSPFSAGPRAADVAPHLEQIAGLLNSGVDIICQREVHDPGGNYEPPACPSCAATLDTGTHIELIEPWLTKGEPEVTCVSCNESALLGDWPGQFALHVANLAVQFNNWPPLTEEFTRELGGRLGARSRVIYQHY
ncbi:MAG TPA: hypothetical protein VGX23_08185 [Actinocrinis sp.]|nr:hypothetical protein [Actinocrinis sp.]